MYTKLKYYSKEVAIFIIIIFIVANAISLYKSSSLNKEKYLLHSTKLIEGSNFTRNPNKPILVHIWAIWCPTCKVEASNIQYVSKDMQTITIAVKSGSNDDIKLWMQENNYNFNVINDYNGNISSDFNIQVFPSTLIYNKDGKVVFSDVGYTSTLGLYIRMWLAEFL